MAQCKDPSTVTVDLANVQEFHDWVRTTHRLAKETRRMIDAIEAKGEAIPCEAAQQALDDFYALQIRVGVRMPAD